MSENFEENQRWKLSPCKSEKQFAPMIVKGYKQYDKTNNIGGLQVEVGRQIPDGSLRCLNYSYHASQQETTELRTLMLDRDGGRRPSEFLEKIGLKTTSY